MPNLHLGSLKRLDATKLKHQAIFEKTAVNLDRKKERMFKVKDLSKWEMSVEDMKRGKDLLNNKDEAYKAMFHKDNQELAYLRDNYLFLVNKCYNEIRRTNRYDMFGTLSNYQKLCERLKDCICQDLQNWGDFEMKYKDESFPIEKDDYFGNLHVKEAKGDAKPEPERGKDHK